MIDVDRAVIDNIHWPLLGLLNEVVGDGWVWSQLDMFVGNRESLALPMRANVRTSIYD